MGRAIAPPARPATATFLHDRMTEWGNDDLLFTKAQRDLVDTEFPGAALVFDFPELRARFEQIDGVATSYRRQRHRSGITAVMFAAFGAFLSALLPVIELLGGDFPRSIFAVSAAVSLVGLVWALHLAYVDPRKDGWLENRLRSERLRQFFFQFLLSNPELGARAMHDAASLKRWKHDRAVAFRHFEAWLAKPASSELTTVIDDVNQRRNWFAESWKHPPRLTGDVDLTDYLTLLRRLRIDVQLAYVREKLAPGMSSPETKWAIASSVSWIFALTAVLLTSVSAILLFRGMAMDAPAFVIVASMVALCGVASALVRVIAEGLQLRTDRDRYRWYREAVEEVDASFHNPDPHARLAALRELEELSYREMREFLKTHGESRFNFG